MRSRSIYGVVFILIYGMNCIHCEELPIAGRLVVPADQNGLEAITLEGGDERSREVETRATGYGGGSCLGGTMCVPMSECTSMYYEVAKSCYNGDRSMYCGGTQYEPYICCPKSPLDHSNVCGKTLVAGQFYRGLGAFPFVARIGFRNIKQNTVAYPCTGSVISKRVILTAAHCALAKAEGYRLASVRLGEYDTSTDPDCSTSGFCAPTVINHVISHVVIHPDYKHGHYHHDIALVILKTPLNYTVATQPICLHPDRENLVVGKRATVVGWGKMSHLQRQPIMQFLEVPLTAWDQCARIYGQTGALESPKSVDGQWMCAGGEGRDVCAGFGGAPLVIKENGVYLQVGIMSFGSDNCGGRNTPSVYTSIAHFIQWIRENSPLEYY